MKIICIAAIAVLCFSCNRKAALSTNSHPVLNYTDSRGNQQLLGTHKLSDLQQAPYAEWFDKNYDSYKTDSVTAEKLKPLVKNKRFEIYMGTWCGDSKREVPRMYKILAYAGVSPSQIQLVMLDNRDSVYKQSPQHEEKNKNIHRVPDLLVYENHQELNRIIEYPVTSIEKDLLAILQQQNYQPNYKGAAFLQQLTARGVPPLSDTTELANKIKTLVQNAAELNSLGYVWMAAKETDKSLLAFHLNACLYPTVANVYDSLGEIYLKLHKKEVAILYYRKVIDIDPKNANALKMLQQLQ
ncbi:MAG: hypothetical protein QM726_17225 [Chitinophagaceae bacterium]